MMRLEKADSPIKYNCIVGNDVIEIRPDVGGIAFPIRTTSNILEFLGWCNEMEKDGYSVIV